MHHLRRPLVLACFAFLSGAAFGLRFGEPAVVVAAAGVVLLILLYLCGGDLADMARRAGPLGVVLAAGMAHGAGVRAAAAGDCRARIADGAELRVEGLLAASHLPADSGGRGAALTLSAAPFRADGVRCAGELRVRLPRGFPRAEAGARVRVSGAWWRNPPPVAPSPWPSAGLAPGFLMARDAEVVAPVGVRSPLLWARGRSQASVDRLFPRQAPLAEALLLNRRERLDPALSQVFAASGLVHLLAISGSHVAMIGGVLLLLARTARCSRRTAAWATIVLVALYLALIGAPPSALRSGLMLSLVLLGGVLQRPSSPVSAMAAAALALVALDPLTLLDAGFQLSFAGVAGLCLLRPRLLGYLPRDWLRAAWSRAAADALVSSVAAFATTAPVVAFHFGQAAPVSILANLPAIPLASLGLVGVAAAVVLEPVAGPLARLLADGAGACLDLLAAVAAAAARLPGGHFAVSRPSVPLWLAGGAVVAVALHLGRSLRPAVRGALAAGSVAALLLMVPRGAAAGEGGLEIAFLDVGQGDAVAIRTPAGRWVLVDAGPIEERYDAGERRVLPYLRTRGATRLEALVLTHPHADHIGGASAVMRGMPVGRLVEPGLPFASSLYRDVLRTAETRGVAWAAARQDRVIRIDGVEILILWPTPPSLDSPEDANDISAVLQIRYGAFRALLEGDAPAWVEERLVARYGEGLRSSVLKAGHHGSRTATSTTYLRAVSPELVVLSCGRRNRYGHPHRETLARLRAAGTGVARTDQDGTVVVRVDPGGGAWRWDSP